MAIHAISGCFDHLHEGHKHILETAKHYGGSNHTLHVMLNSDEYIQRVKGRKPQPLLERVKNIMPYATHWYCIEHSPTEILMLLRPDRVFVGDDYTLEQVLGRDYVGEVVIVPRIPGHSSSVRC